ncbi:MAG: methyltransferase domain-containing protein [Gaiellaceae bacterium]
MNEERHAATAPSAAASSSAEAVRHYDFCTLFDKDYLFKGVALYESLRRHVTDFTLWILCMDDTAFEVLGRMALPNVRLLSLEQFEDDELLAAKKTRTTYEYYWTCTPSLPLYLLEHEPELESVTYLDADLFFFSDPAPAFAEFGDGSTSLIEHRFAPAWEHLLESSGIYCVQFMIFRNDERALAALRWWRDRCNEWCYHRVEDGKMGDQKYLEAWPGLFAGVVVLQHKGAGLAPWNLAKYSIEKVDGELRVDDERLIFYHFHSLTILNGGKDFLLAYPEYGISKANAKLLYSPYVRALKDAISRVQEYAPGYAFGISDEVPDGFVKRLLARRVAQAVNVAKSVPPLRWAWRRIKRLHGRRESVPGLAQGDQRDSWKVDDVAKQQQALVEKELRDPESVAPFKTFLEIVQSIVDEGNRSVYRFLDIGCGVGHYSELLHRYHPARFAFTGSDYSEAMIRRARALWPHSEFVVDDVFDSGVDYSSYDILMASALVDVIDDFWAVLDILFSNTSDLLVLHRQRLTESASYSEMAPRYEGQTTYSTYLNRAELEERLARHGLRIKRDFAVSDNVRSFLIERTSAPAEQAP